MTSVFGLFGHWLYYKAFSKEDASIVSPIRLLTPPIVLITGFFVLGEKASFWGIIGVLTTIVGLWFLISPEGKKISLANVFERKGILLGILGAVLYGIAFPFDKKAIITSSALFHVAI